MEKQRWWVVHKVCLERQAELPVCRYSGLAWGSENSVGARVKTNQSLSLLAECRLNSVKMSPEVNPEIMWECLPWSEHMVLPYIFLTLASLIPVPGSVLDLGQMTFMGQMIQHHSLLLNLLIIQNVLSLVIKFLPSVLLKQNFSSVLHPLSWLTLLSTQLRSCWAPKFPSQLPARPVPIATSLL